MTITRTQFEIETVSFIAFAVAVSMFFLWQNNQKYRQFPIVTPVVNMTETAPAQAMVKKVDIASQISSDGEKKVIMKTTNNNTGTLTYVFSTADGSGDYEKEIYTTTLSAEETMSIPFNTWSPDNKYLFIQKGDRGFMVFKDSGEAFSDGQLFLDLTDLFAQRKTGHNLSEATGWGSETLIIINTAGEGEAKGPSYWFEVPSKAIIQLSTEF